MPGSRIKKTKYTQNKVQFRNVQNIYILKVFWLWNQELMNKKNGKKKMKREKLRQQKPIQAKNNFAISICS